LQQENGMWREVLDYPGASGTAMIAIAMLRGIRPGWLERETYQPLIDAPGRQLSCEPAPTAAYSISLKAATPAASLSTTTSAALQSWVVTTVAALLLSCSRRTWQT